MTEKPPDPTAIMQLATGYWSSATLLAANDLHLFADPEATCRFVLGMHNRIQGVARGLLPFLDFSGARRLLDVGGGPGTFAVLLAQKYPDLQVTVLDLPEVVSIARELIQEAGA